MHHLRPDRRRAGRNRSLVMVAAPAPLSWPSPTAGWYGVFVLTVAYTLSFIDRSILTLLVAPIRADLGISDTGFSLLHGFAFTIFYTTLGIPIAAFADRMNRRDIIASGIAFWSLATVCCGFARSFAQLFVARVGVGAGEAALSPAAYSMIADLFPPHRLGRALAVFALGAYIGVGLAYLVGGAVVAAVSTADIVSVPLLGEMQSWQLVFVAIGLPGLPIALWMLTVREPARRSAAVATSSIRESLRECLRYMRTHWRAYTAVFVGFSLLGVVFSITMVWAPTYLIRVHALSPARAGLWLGTFVLAFGIPGVLTGGWLADRWRSAGLGDSTLRVGIVSAVCMLPFGALATLLPSLELTLALLALLIFFSTLPFGASAAAIQLVTPAALRASTSSIYLCCLNLVAVGAAPTLVALLTDRLFMDDRAVGRSLAVTNSAVVPIAGAVLWWGLAHFRHAAARRESNVS